MVQVATPPRHTATAASAFQRRLAAAAASSSSPWNSDDEEEQSQPAALEQPEPGSRQPLSGVRSQPELVNRDSSWHQSPAVSAGASISLASGSGRSSVSLGSHAAEAQKSAAPLSGNATVRRLFHDLSSPADGTAARDELSDSLPQWATQAGQDREFGLQRLQHSSGSPAESVAIVSPDQGPRQYHTTNRSYAAYHSQAYPTQLPIVSGDSDSEPDKASGPSGYSHAQHEIVVASPRHSQSNSQLKSRTALNRVQLPVTDSVQLFLARLNSPHKGGAQPDANAQLSLSNCQFDQQTGTRGFHQRMPISHESSTSNAASWSPSQQQPVMQLQSHSSKAFADAAELTSGNSVPTDKWVSASHADNSTLINAAPAMEWASDAASSPVQAAVAAVASRLQLVQQGLSSAEGRLAHLTGERAVARQGFKHQDSFMRRHMCVSSAWWTSHTHCSGSTCTV